MRATKSSRASRISRATRSLADENHVPLRELSLVAALLSIFGIAAAVWHHAQGFPLYYGDAEAHLNIARRILDSRTPGYDQIGTVWLPLPHVFMLPFVQSMDLWRTGMAGTIPSVACYVVAGTLLFGAARLAFGTFPAGLAAALLFGTNPNVLYLATTPMSEPVFLAM